MTTICRTVDVEIDAADFVNKWMDNVDVKAFAKLLHEAGKGKQTIDYLVKCEGGITAQQLIKMINSMLDDYQRDLEIRSHLVRLGRDVCNRVIQ